MELNKNAQYQTTKKIIRAILSANARGAKIHELNNTYKEYEGQSIPFYDYGFTSLSSFLGHMSDTVRLEHDKLFAVEIEETKHVIDMVNEQNSSAARRSTSRRPPKNPIRNETQKRSALFCNPPLHQNQSPHRTYNYAYHWQTNAPNNIWKNAFFPMKQIHNLQGSSISHMNARSAESEVRNARFEAVRNDSNAGRNDTVRNNPIENKSIQSTNETECIDAKNAISKVSPLMPETVDSTEDLIAKSLKGDDLIATIHKSNEQSYSENTKRFPSTDTENTRLSATLNIDIGLQIGFDLDEIELGCLPDANFDISFTIGEMVGIYMGQIYSPFKFWFQTREHGSQLDELMPSLGEKYFKNSEQKRIFSTEIPDKYLRTGRLCAALYDRVWHRAKIVDVMDCSVKVYYVDYGTVAEVLKSNVRFLSKEFSRLPALATRGCLDRIRPKNGIWSIQAMELFMNKMTECTESLTIFARITALNREEKTVYMDLIDASNEIDIDIAHLLIQGNHCWKTRKLLNDFVKRHWNDVYPSFDKLESGQYPSITEILEWHSEDGFNYMENELLSAIDEMYGYETIE